MDFLSPDLTAAPEFDYGAFFQGVEQNEDIDYLAEESSASTNTLGEHVLGVVPGAVPPTSTTTQALTVQRPPSDGGGSSPGSGPVAKQRLERRGHTKSRRGCFNCKRRRIKAGICQETRPACGHCVKTGLKCEYPAMPVVVHQPQHQIPLFSLQDMRFFQHFLFRCYPHHPIGAEDIWLHEIPCLSQKYDYLMHAILGYAASELIAEDPTLAAPAMAHRVKAIKAVKKSLAEAPKANTFEEGNALMATCFALTFQSVLLDDGLAEYMTFIRGIIIVAIQMYIKGAKLLFGEFLGDKQDAVLKPYIEQVPLINKEWTDAAVAAIRALEPLCRADEIERTYHGMLLEMAEKLYVSSWEAYQALSKHYGWWMMLPHEQFQRLIDPGNQTCVLLASHWIALKQIMAIITETDDKAWAKRPEPDRKAQNDMGVGLVKWLRYLNRLVDGEHRALNTWPVWVEETLARNPRYFGKTR
ncbi:C6 zinc finger protein [Echria macrotheca]|uniref:C6 zinc finger protein n=1 Tax=Echria macrotheca TaxID=438768 RepID=A0AAJ0B1S5_9PEZI|nr:C6 zinc finger protein [Echria macrotheca]